ncbi:MAG TPA: 5-oxoprolinase subunit PxpB [Burkholderiales bacterium]|nr:5-oxoprolinase subunit PxpB [Burkholderiales bacterium]
MVDLESLHLSFSPLGDRALLVELASEPGPETSASVRAIADRVRTMALPGVSDIVPAFCSVALHYDPAVLGEADSERTPYDALVLRLQESLFDADALPQEDGRLHEIPVAYGGRFGEDLDELAATLEMGADTLIELHCATTYSVYMLGFAPGFPYLGPLDHRLIVPRRDSPRTQVPAGSVAVANAYTAVYPLNLPGGWHLLGRTPLTLFDPNRDPPALLSAGDRVRFVPIDAAEFARLENGART